MRHPQAIARGPEVFLASGPNPPDLKARRFIAGRDEIIRGISSEVAQSVYLVVSGVSCLILGGLFEANRNMYMKKMGWERAPHESRRRNVKREKVKSKKKRLQESIALNDRCTGETCVEKRYEDALPGKRCFSLRIPVIALYLTSSSSSSTTSPRPAVLFS